MNVKVLKRCFSLMNRRHKPIRVLGIETSCDDTAAAVVDSDRNILGEARFIQTGIHVLNGGILPHLAESLHSEKIKDVINETMEKSKLTFSELDAIAVTVQPGQIHSLRVGCQYAKDLCITHGKPLIPIHHMEAHALTSRLTDEVDFPFMVLLISGGHCILAVSKSITQFLVLGTSSSCAPGLVFDEVSRRMKLKYLKGFEIKQGGLAIDTLSSTGDPLAIHFGQSLNMRRNCNFNFNGIRSKVFQYIEQRERELNLGPDELLPNIGDVCASFQYCLVQHICRRVEIGMKYIEQKKLMRDEKKTLVVSGGVASNKLLRTLLREVCSLRNYEFSIPPPSLCTDNGVMVAWNGIEKMKANLPLVESRDFHLVRCEQRCPLGESLADDVDREHVSGGYANLDKILRTLRSESDPKKDAAIR